MDTTGTHLWLVLMKAHRTLQRLAVRSVEATELGLSDFGVLEMLLHKGPLAVNDIGRRIELTSGAITVCVDRLEERGWVERSFHPEDRRARIVALTARGRTRAAEAFASHKAAMDSAASALDRSERATLIELLKKLGTTAKEER